MHENTTKYFVEKFCREILSKILSHVLYSNILTKHFVEDFVEYFLEDFVDDFVEDFGRNILPKILSKHFDAHLVEWPQKSDLHKPLKKGCIFQILSFILFCSGTSFVLRQKEGLIPVRTLPSMPCRGKIIHHF